MTREEVRVKIDELINEIYSEFENNICENCIHHMNYTEDCECIDSYNDTYCNMIGINTPDYFGCNEFERKN